MATSLGMSNRPTRTGSSNISAPDPAAAGKPVPIAATPRSISGDMTQRGRTPAKRPGASGDMRRMADSQVVRVAPKVYSPLFEMTNLMLPRDQRTLNAWNRHFWLCLDSVTLTLTNKGYLPWDQIIEVKDSSFVGEDIAIGLIDPDIKVACFNSDTEEIEFHTPEACHVYNFDTEQTGDFMYQFQTTKMDQCVTPDHRMFVDKIGADSVHWQSKWRIQSAKDIVHNTTRFRAHWNWKGQKAPKSIQVDDKSIAIDPYLKLLGYYISEGCTQSSYRKREIVRKHSNVCIAQHQYRREILQSDYVTVEADLRALPYKIRPVKDSIGTLRGNHCNGEAGNTYFAITGIALAEHLVATCGHLSHNKRIPRHILEYDKEYLQILLNALMLGDGTISTSNDYGRIGTNAVKQYIYTTVSKQLAEDVYELVQKCGYVPTLTDWQPDEPNRQLQYHIHFSESQKGHFPVLKSNAKQFKSKEIQQVPYKGVVYCFEVPPHNLFVTRRNGKTVITGNTNPIVRNCITLHATYPLSKMRISHPDPKIQQFFEDMMEDIDFEEVMSGISLEYWINGEVFPHTELDEDRGVWRQIIIHNPDYVTVKANLLARDPLISLIPDEALRRMVYSTRVHDQRLREQIPEDVIYYIQRGENIPLSNFNVTHLKLLAAPYDIRGTSILTCVYKDLMLYDKLREMEFAQADNLINPITLVKLGDPQGGWRPTDTDIGQFQRIMEEAQYDPDFRIITHGAVSIERVGASGSVIDTTPKMQQIYKNLFAGLFTPESIINNEGPTYASASVGLEVLQQRYRWYQDFIRKFIRKKVFAPLSIIQGFYKNEDGQRRLQVPEVTFDKINLRDVVDYINALSSMAGAEGPVSNKSLLRTVDLDVGEEAAEKRKDLIDTAILEKEAEALQNYGLEELRALDASKPIPAKELPSEGLPGELTDEELLPEDMPDMGPGGGGDMGDMPDIEDLGEAASE